MMSDFPNFQEAMQADQAIYQLAAYDVAKGLIIIPESADQVVDIQRGIAQRFNYFKRLIQNSETTFSDIHKTVVAKYGPFPNRGHNMSVDEFIKEIEESDHEEKPPNQISGVLNKLLGDIIKLTGSQPVIVSSDMGDVEVIPIPIGGMGELSEIQYLDDKQEIDDFMEASNPLLIDKTGNKIVNKTDTQTDSIPPKKRVLPKIETPSDGEKTSKGKNSKNGRKIKTTKPKPKPRKSQKDKTDT